MADTANTIDPSQAQRRTVLITGCSLDGLGYALAVAFHNTGKFRVFATARDPTRMQPLKDQGIECLRLDVCDQESVNECVSKVRELTREGEEEGEGRLDCLVNNAGGGGLSFLSLLLPGFCRRACR